MSPPNWKNIEQEEVALARELDEGRITPAAYRKEMHELQRDIAAIYNEDREDALDRVNRDWGL